MILSVCVQQHPLRGHLLSELLARLGGTVDVVTDPDPFHPVRSPLRCYIECLRRTPPEATHRLIVQDDAWPCDDFVRRSREAIAEHPDALTALFVPGVGAPGNAVKRAVRAGASWAKLPHSWTPTVALAWPSAAVAAFLAYASRYDPHKARGDDGPVGRWRQDERWECWAPVPSLVEHPDVEPSLIGRRHFAGRNRARIAAAPPA